VRAIASRLTELPIRSAGELVSRMLRVIAALHRPEFLNDLRCLTPVVVRLDGMPANDEIAQAVQEVCDWWG
jgi:hypothetical protein